MPIEQRSAEVIERERALVTAMAIDQAAQRLKDIALLTSLQHSRSLSDRTGAAVFLKREDQQPVRSYKLRGAGNRMAMLDASERGKGVVTASAGNHAQGVALAAARLGIMTNIVMPGPTPQQKIERVAHFGGDFVHIHLEGNTFDDAAALACIMTEEQGSIYVPPFNDPHVIAGQGTVGLEILEQALDGIGPIDGIIVPIGGGGLVAGLGTYVKEMSPNTRIIGVEPDGAAAMKASLQRGELVTLPHIDPFVDGAAVKTPGDLTFAIAKDVIDDIVTVSEGEVCEAMIAMANNDGVWLEPAGALSIAALRQLGDAITGKRVVSVVSGANIGAERIPAVLERASAEKYTRQPFSICI